jgi:hypothetical protein
MKQDSPWIIAKRVILVALAAFFLRLTVLVIVPDPSKPALNTSPLLSLISTLDRYLPLVHKSRPDSGRARVVWENSPAQKMRDEVVLMKLSEMALNEESTPPPPRVSLFPPGKVDENEQMRILEHARFHHELDELVHGRDREKELSDAPGPQTSDVKAGDTPLPEDMETQRIIADLKEEAEKERSGKISAEAAALGIKGPAASRTISHMPHPLQVKAPLERGALLKFWLLPDGTVSNVIPLGKGDVQSTALVINHFKKYRFNALPPDDPQVEMWGTIPLKSVLQ